MKKTWLLWLGLVLGIVWTGMAKARVIGVYVYQKHVFVEESFAVKPGENKLILAGAPEAETLTCGAQKGALKIVSLHVQKTKGQGPLYQKLEAIHKQLRGLVLQEDTLAEEIELLKGMLKAPQEIPSPETYQRYMDLLADCLQKKDKLTQKINKLKEEEASLKQMLAGGKVSVLDVKLKGQGSGILLVRYPADNLLSIKRVYQVSLATDQGLVEVRGQALVQQFSGQNWSGVTFYFYPRAPQGRVLNPPPFKPWYLGAGQPVWRGIALKVQEKGPYAPGIPQREIAVTGVWERIKIPSVDLPAGKKVLVDLGRETFPAQVVLEVPVYATAQAYFRAEIISPVSLPPLKALVYRDGLYLGETRIPAFLPGKKITLYFGPAPLLEVKRQVLKDTTGKPFFHRGREVTEKVFRTVLLNHYTRTFAVEVVDRVPVSKRKEIKVKVSALPRWQALTPEGKAIWRLDMSPNSTKEIRLQIEINQPARR